MWNCHLLNKYCTITSLRSFFGHSLCLAQRGSVHAYFTATWQKYTNRSEEGRDMLTGGPGGDRKRGGQSHSVVTYYPFTAVFEVQLWCLLMPVFKCMSMCFILFYLLPYMISVSKFISKVQENVSWCNYCPDYEFNQISHLHSCNRSTDAQKRRIDPKNRPCWMTSFTCIIRQIQTEQNHTDDLVIRLKLCLKITSSSVETMTNPHRALPITTLFLEL